MMTKGQHEKAKKSGRKQAAKKGTAKPRAVASEVVPQAPARIEPPAVQGDLPGLIEASPWAKRSHKRGADTAVTPAVAAPSEVAEVVRRPESPAAGAAITGNLFEAVNQWQRMAAHKRSVGVTEVLAAKTPALDEAPMAALVQRMLEGKADQPETVTEPVSSMELPVDESPAVVAETAPEAAATQPAEGVLPEVSVVVNQVVETAAAAVEQEQQVVGPTNTDSGETEIMAHEDDVVAGGNIQVGLEQLQAKVEELRRKGGEIRRELSSMDSVKAAREMAQESPAVAAETAGPEARHEASPLDIPATEAGSVARPSVMEEVARQKQEAEPAPAPRKPEAPAGTARPAAQKARARPAARKAAAPETTGASQGQEIVVEELFEGLASTLGGGLGYLIEKGQSAACGVAASVSSSVGWVGGLCGRLRRGKAQTAEACESAPSEAASH